LKMSGTRRTTDLEGPIAMERYMSNPAYVARRGVPANVVAEKALLCKSAAHRRLLFFLQALSCQDGGLGSVAHTLLDKAGDFFSNMSRLESELGSGIITERVFVNYLASGGKLTDWRPELLELFLLRLCIDPSINVEKLAAIRDPKCDPIGALEHLQKLRIRDQSKTEVVTSIGREVHRALDQAHSTRRMIVVEGLAGSGKTVAAQQWCQKHLGDVRFISLKGIIHRTGFFQTIASALGMAACQRKSSELQAKIESFFHRIKLMLVIDEAHFLWPQAPRVYTNPELVDWVDTALINNGIPVALICTDQFAKHKARVEKQIGWTSDQFIHRVSRFITLPQKLTREDLCHVARNLLAMRWSTEDEKWVPDSRATFRAEAINAAVVYAQGTALPLPAIRSIVEDARFTAREKNRDRIALPDLKSAILAQTTSDTSLRLSFDDAREPSSSSRRRRGTTARPVPPARQMSNFSTASPTRSRIALVPSLDQAS
jgi:hypothetical protein